MNANAVKPAEFERARVAVSENLVQVLAFVRGLMVASWYEDTDGDPTDFAGKKLKDLRNERHKSC